VGEWADGPVGRWADELYRASRQVGGLAEC